MCAWRNIEVCSCNNNSCSGKARSITYCGYVQCVGRLRHPACSAHAPCFHLCPVRLYNVFSRYLINDTDLKKKALNIKCSESYVCWTVQHRDSWIKRDQLDVTCYLFLYLLLNMFRMLIHPSSGACDLFVELFHGLYCSGSMCVGVTAWFGWGGVVSVCRLQQPAYGYHTTPTYRNTNTHRTRAIQPMK